MRPALPDCLSEFSLACAVDPYESMDGRHSRESLGRPTVHIAPGMLARLLVELVYRWEALMLGMAWSLL